MSGCSYSCLVYPAAGHFNFVPSVSQLEATIRGLAADGWVEASGRGWRGVSTEQTGAFRKVPLQLGSLSSNLADLAVASTFTVEIHNSRDAGDPTPFEEDGEGIFRPAYCEDAYLFVSAVPLAVEDPYGTDECACMRCRKNILASRSEHADPAIRRALLQPPQYAPSCCPHCKAELDLAQLSMSLTTVIDSSSPRVEVAPFFRFAVWLLPVEKRYPETERVMVDPGVLMALQTACGVPFRSVGTLSCS
jgi:hypothetical protein